MHHYLVNTIRAIASIVSSAFIMSIAAWPFWLFLALYYLADPSGFWQKLALSVVGLFFLGAIQLFMLIIGVIVVLTVLSAIWEL